MTVTPKKKLPKTASNCRTPVFTIDSYVQLLESPKVCTRKEMECERLRGKRLCHTAPNFKATKRSVTGCTRPRPVSFRDPPPLLSHLYTPSKLETYLDQVFYKIRTLGQGSFGNVHCMGSRHDGRLYAVKCSQTVYRSNYHRKEKLREVRLLEKLEHQNIVRFYFSWEENDLLFIQTELCERSLLSYIFDTDGQVPELTIWNAFAVDYIHSNEVVHVDIKPDNILVTNKEVFKLGDFGMAVDMLNDPPEDMDREGDAKYLAAEALNQDIVTKEMDIFSFGLSIFQLATDLWVPTNGQSWHDIRQSKFNDDILNRCPDLLRPILLQMMAFNAGDRPTARQIMEHETVAEKLARRLESTANLKWDDTSFNRFSSPIRSYPSSRSPFFEQSPVLRTPPNSRMFDNASLFTPARKKVAFRRTPIMLKT